MHTALQEKPPNQDKEEAKRTWRTGKPTMSALDEKVDCAWLQSGLTGHRGTDRILDKRRKAGDCSKPNDWCNDQFKPIQSSECRKKKKMFASGLVNQ